MQKLSIDVTMLDKTKFREVTRRNGKKAIFCDLVLHEKASDFGDGFAALDVTREEREAGEKGAIVGNWKYLGTSPARGSENRREQTRGELPKRPAPGTHGREPRKPPHDPDLDAPDDDIPF